MRILQGKLENSSSFLCGAERKQHRAGHVLKVEGRDHPEIESVAFAGDIVALAKVDEIHVDAVLHAPGTHAEYDPIKPKYPMPMFSLAIAPANRNDEVKLNAALTQLCEEDPTLSHGHDKSTKEMLISGSGQEHVEVAVAKLKRMGVECTLKLPKIPYRETITKSVKYVEYTHKKQTGGAGQYARVFIDVEPRKEGGYEFVDKIVGGVIDHQFRPSVDKGVQSKMAEGVIAGYPVVGVRVSLVDGKTHRLIRRRETHEDLIRLSREL